MYLRTISRKNADGSVVRYHQLAENVWDAGKRCAVAKVVYSFGRSDEIDPAAMRRLARSILRIVPGQDAIAADPDIRMLGAWSYGGLYVLETLWRELELPKVIREHAPKGDAGRVVERALLAMVANRALSPQSKLGCFERWLAEEAFFPGGERLELHHLYRAMDALSSFKEAVEKAVFFRMADLFNLDVDLIFYDTTSLHFEIDEEDEDGPVARKRGYSKNGRADAPQVVVGLAVTRDGVPVRSWVFPGDTGDVTTVERVKKDLRGWKLNRCVFVGDAGMNSAENRRTLSLGGGKYILASRLRAGDEVTEEVLTRAGRYQAVAENLQVKEVVVGDGERRRRYVVCFNPQEAERQARHREEVVKLLEAELATLRPPAKEAAHSKRTCQLLTTDRYRRYLRQTSTGAPRIDRAAIAAEEKRDGKWVLQTNDDTLTPEDLALGYKQLMRVEQCWRVMKSGLRMRPVFHFKPSRVEAHISLCVLALLLERMVEIRTGDTWRNVAAKLDGIKVIEYERGEVRVRQTTEIPNGTLEVLRKMSVAPPPRLHAVAAAASA